MIEEYTPNTKLIKVPDKCPTTGQFVVVWEYDNQIWSGTYKWDGSTHLYEYTAESNKFKKLDANTAWMNKANAKFYVSIRRIEHVEHIWKN